MHTVLLACEVLRPELEMLAAKMADPPEMHFLEQRLHDYPEQLRLRVQAAIDALEQAHTGDLAILCGYGLCGRGLCGVSTGRAVLILPRLHDCIPLLLGESQAATNASSREGATFWITPGWLKCLLIPFYAESHRRFELYAQKAGPIKAARMVRAENALLSAYKTFCHIRWPEMGEDWVEEAQRIAGLANLPYAERPGRSGYMAEFLAGGKDPKKFLHLAPGESADMDADGLVIAVACPERSVVPLPEKSRRAAP